MLRSSPLPNIHGGLLLNGGPTAVYRIEEGILRVGPARVIEAHRRGITRFHEVFGTMDGTAPRLLRWWPEVDQWPPGAGPRPDALAMILEEDLGSPTEDPLGWLAPRQREFMAESSREEVLRGRLRDILPRLRPPGPTRSAGLVRGIREASRGTSGPRPGLGAVERALDAELSAGCTRTWGHGALAPHRVLAGGACHWRFFGPDHLLEEDLAPFVEPDPNQPGLLLHVLKLAWNHDPLRALRALSALGLVVTSPPPAEVRLAVVSRHPAVTDDVLERIMGCRAGLVTSSQAAAALGRAQGLVVAGEPIRLTTSPEVAPRKDAAPWRIRDRDPRRLFSRWHEGIRLDPEARASLTPEGPALDLARAVKAEEVVDAFAGAGGNAIAFARMPWCREVVAVELDPDRLEMARHNAALYGVLHRMELVCGDAFAVLPTLPRSHFCFLDPPWACGPELLAEAWSTARRHFHRGAMKLPRQSPVPADADQVEVVFGEGPVVSFVLAGFGPGPAGALRDS